MRRSGAPSQRSFSGLINLPSPKTSVEKVHLGGGSPGVPDSKNCFQSATHGLSPSAGGGATSAGKDAGSSVTDQGSDVSFSGSAQFSSPSSQTVHMGKPQSPIFQNRSPLLNLNRTTARQPSPAGVRLLNPSPNQEMTSMPTNPPPVMRPSCYINSPIQIEAKKSFPSNLTPAAAVDITNSTTFRCFDNLILFCDGFRRVTPASGTLHVFGGRNLRESTRNGREMGCCG